MFGKKQKIKLSENLKLGVQRPGSKPMLFKIGGVVLLILSALLAGNIYNKTKGGDDYSAEIKTSQQIPTVLGAFDSKTDLKPKIISYKIKKGDTLFNIAQNHNINWQNIVDLNNLKPPYTLKPGDVLKIPAPE